MFASGMAAISTTLLAFLRPGDTLLHSRPLYGGTETLLKNQMGAFGITAVGFTDGIDVAGMRKAADAARAKGRVGLILVETPANPTNGLVDLAACASIADELEKETLFELSTIKLGDPNIISFSSMSASFVARDFTVLALPVAHQITD